MRSLVALGFSVTAFSRLDSGYVPPPGVDLVRAEYSFDSLAKYLRGQDVVVSTVSRTKQAVLLQKQLIGASVAAGVKRFVPAECGMDTDNRIAVQKNPPHQGKTKILSSLGQLCDMIPGFLTLQSVMGPFLTG